MCHIVNMTTKPDGISEVKDRRGSILHAAKWCFLTFGYGKTSLEDIAKRANISRTLIYRMFKNKEDIYVGVFEDWFGSRYPIAQELAAGAGSKAERLLRLCEVMLLEAWDEIAGAPMGSEFYEMCATIAPEVVTRHRSIKLQSVQTIIESRELAEVFLQSLDGLQGDYPTAEVLRRRTKLLIDCFV